MRKIIFIMMLLIFGDTLVIAQEKANTGQLPYAEGSTSNFEVVIEYNNIEPNKESKLTFYISDFKTNVPVENAKLEVDIPGIDNSKVNILSSNDPGIYEVLVEFPEIKKYTFLINISSGETNDLVAINDVDIGVKEEELVMEKESKSISTIINGNLLLIIIFTVIIIFTAFLFYRIGKKKSSAVNINADTKEFIKEIEI